MITFICNESLVYINDELKKQGIKREHIINVQFRGEYYFVYYWVEV